MRITVAYNLRTRDEEAQAELLTEEDIDRLCIAISELGHRPAPVEVSGMPDVVVGRLLESEPELIFNIAEGTRGVARESFYPSLYSQLGIPFTGSDSSLLYRNEDKSLAKTVVSVKGVNVPPGALVTGDRPDPPEDLEYPLIVKPNYEGSSKGITQASVVNSPEECRERIGELLDTYPGGLIVEEFIEGRELTVPMLSAWPGKILEIDERKFDLDGTDVRYNIYDYDSKRGSRAKKVHSVCPARLTDAEREAVMTLAKKVYDVMNCADLGRVDIRLSTDGVPYFIELNPLPSFHPKASLIRAAGVVGLSYKDVVRLVIESAVSRMKLPGGVSVPRVPTRHEPRPARPTAREAGIIIGRFPAGTHNAITDVQGVKVGHVTIIEDNVAVPGRDEGTSVRTGLTAILPGGTNFYDKHIMAGGFVLNGIGEMAGLTQVLEWGWLETPILLSDTMHVGPVHDGVVRYMLEEYPDLMNEPIGRVIIPVVGETNDSFLNDVRIRRVAPVDVRRAIERARGGPVAQGSVGAGTGMISFDFAGGIGTSSRVLPPGDDSHTVGVLVLSNFGKMRNLTVDGSVVGRSLDPMFPVEGRRGADEGSVIVVVATDAPLLSNQLNRLAKRAALGLGRVGSHASSTSGEILISFSTGNITPRREYGKKKYIRSRFISESHVDALYEAVVEATEEAVVNAIFSSGGMTGHSGRSSPALPHNEVRRLLGVEPDAMKA